MKKAKVFVNGIPAGELQGLEQGKRYRVVYFKDYVGPYLKLVASLGRSVFFVIILFFGFLI